jgi:hypothetical protein
MIACICEASSPSPTAVFLLALPVFAVGLAGALLLRDLPLATRD